MHWGRVGGGLLVLAGVYQLTPLKGMGLTHGLYCMGCCWLLFLVLVPLGVMNVAAMAGVAVLVLVEKVAPWGRPAAFVAAPVLVVAGVAVLLRPELLPTVA